MPPRKWARVLQSGAHGLRRGAWYQVVNDSSPSMVILDVSKKNVPVDRNSLEIADGKPVDFSVVKWHPGKPLPHRMSEKNLPRIYAVCPSCRSRTDQLAAGTQTIKCVECGHEAAGDWEKAC